jgi:hypothetical protein
MEITRLSDESNGLGEGLSVSNVGLNPGGFLSKRAFYQMSSVIEIGNRNK